MRLLACDTNIQKSFDVLQSPPNVATAYMQRVRSSFAQFLFRHCSVAVVVSQLYIEKYYQMQILPPNVATAYMQRVRSSFAQFLFRHCSVAVVVSQLYIEKYYQMQILRIDTTQPFAEYLHRQYAGCASAQLRCRRDITRGACNNMALY